ncbi:hypothetical protein [Rheinheimera baltica]|uniref:hypothetical protein n=1 Tax=Rheinheimera baltica TaxID=67576 RepID=UPI000405DDC0|nr:hypothetical protein [Rheinheimera baltica]
MLDTAERLIISEIGDFAASLPGGPVTASDAEQLQKELIERVQRVFADIKLQGSCSIPAILKRPRSDWTAGQWAEHVGGRNKDDDPLKYYEFGSLIAVVEMLQQFAKDQQKAGWNACCLEMQKHFIQRGNLQ